MTIEATLERVSAIRQALADPAALVGANGIRVGAAESPSAVGVPPAAADGAAGTAVGESSFASALRQASAGYQAPTPGAPVSPYSLQSLSGVAAPAVGPATLAPGGGPGSEIVAIAESQLGQSEQPPGSNESPAIAQYRSATAGALPGAPWCAYFASWVARQAGEPIGELGQGAGSVTDVWSWAQRSGRAIPNGPGVVPRPGDLIVFGGEHVGIVRDVLPSGQIQTIEGNYENKVAANVRSPSEATGYVSMN
jgi:hypothetical protein